MYTIILGEPKNRSTLTILKYLTWYNQIESKEHPGQVHCLELGPEPEVHDGVLVELTPDVQDGHDHGVHQHRDLKEESIRSRDQYWPMRDEYLPGGKEPRWLRGASWRSAWRGNQLAGRQISPSPDANWRKIASYIFVYFLSTFTLTWIGS